MPVALAHQQTTLCKCGDLGWLVKRWEDETGQYRTQLVACPHCEIVKTRRFELLWEINHISREMRGWTFKNFDRTRENVSTGHKAVYVFARDIHMRWQECVADGAPFNMPDYWAVTLWGPPGCGKTHLGTALFNAMQSCGIPALFCDAQRLWPWLGCTSDYDPDVSYESRFTVVATVPVLILDELGGQLNANGTVKLTDAMLDRRQRLIRYRYENRLPTLVLDNRDPDDWHDDAIVDRLLARQNPCVSHGSLDSYRRHGPGQGWAERLDEARFAWERNDQPTQQALDEGQV